MSEAIDIVDAAEREAALDPRRSIIVQAPAGSGKTGLLIQRFLRLLATVSKPEEVLAITFTRKAAAEMRRRVLEAFAAARDGEKPEDENKALTWLLARDVLARDAEKRWGLLDNAARLRIQTIDSLCASLARQMPVLSGLGAPPAIVEDARDLYREAAQRTLARVNEGDADVARVVAHLDGDWEMASFLLENMLSRRDQWLRRVAGVKAGGATRAALEEAMRSERSRVMQRARRILPPAIERDFCELVRFAASNIAIEKPHAPLAKLDKLAGYPPLDETGAGAWMEIANLLLTSPKGQEVNVRKTVNVSQGFPAGKGPQARFKERMIELLEAFAAMDGFIEPLHALRTMPPSAFSEEQWAALGSVVEMLPRAAAELQVVFAERGEIDFTGIAQAAVQALGTEDEPTNLLLALDVKLQHLLVDEFQDTSHGQWELLTRLTSGWQPDDGRTVFLVGDPMQSIYRFREADVSLFLRARSQGLPQVALADLRLATNFRSQAGVVEWVNKSFRAILPREEDPDEGAVPYSDSSAKHPLEPGPAVQWHPFLGTDMALAQEREAVRVVEVVKAALVADASQTIAILVRNRSNLDSIVPAMRKANIRFRAVEIEQLEGRQVIQDLLAVTRALSHPADRVAWLGVLRAPWCALTLADLLALTGPLLSSEGARETLWELMADPSKLEGVSADGRARIARVRDTLAPFIEQRLRGTLRERVESAWLALGGPACAFSESDLEDAETYFDQLDRLQRAGELPDVAVLAEKLQRLYAAPDTGEEARVQVMTIHKAKGLEFDTVIVPGLHRAPRISDRPLFAWKSRADGTILMAPVRPTRMEGEPAYDYLRGLSKAAEQHELERVLYVAATRAAKRLHLMGYARLKTEDGTIRRPPSTTLLGKAWSVAEPAFCDAIPQFLAGAGEKKPKDTIRTDLRRLDPTRLAMEVPEPAWEPPPSPEDTSSSIAFIWVKDDARHVGTLTHRWLQRIAVEGLASWDASRIAALAQRVTRELASRGVAPEDLPRATSRVIDSLQGAISDPRGRWVLAPYADARCEYRIRVAGPDGVRLLVIDRIFTEGDRRWIVDYKTSSHEGGELEAFLDSERTRYSEQMARYAPAFDGAAGSMGLYFPLVKGWREWTA
ncbi:UvrD-helicase domain-containing protein [Usitatibacter palustris]|uniref:DNA 3'-5' helicase n=1 Tax=Usitatibacter palustris TaxID=2732487 RepID=A0A6M4H7L8_9PROT|nr:UvrD-helicase domain-containing protein [Usitatibacter palustris]QJR13987.1 RecBCD enzyme subunit RecB [Usitatibacter palustris]